MLELFRDPVWQFIGAAVTFLFGLVAAAQWILQFRQRTKKSFCWEIRRVPLFRHREDTKGRLKVLFDGTSIRDADIVLIRLLNSGNVPIVPSDFVQPVTIVFGETDQILHAEVAGTNPQDLGTTLTSDPRAAVLNPVLLNSGDYVTVKVFVTPSGARPNVHARIVGADIAELRNEIPAYIRPLGIISAVFLILFVILALVLQSVYLGVFLAGFAVAGVYGYILQRARLAVNAGILFLKNANLKFPSSNVRLLG